ncbi:hypothetical protein JG687_00015673 [Phytophthora cactorum]|uniref:ZSWIM1/3 RNaseH-like domain-containing protein n=1 Tax=Phytophthora cactorum TaxID=29920 RepID=A0A8T1TXA7_9STRA|nr:hypothetical protein JG687_00015673 [Phytophthora cactorum]
MQVIYMRLRRTFVVDILYGCTGVQLSDNDAVAELILGFNQESPKNVSSVHESERGDTGVISFTSGHMVSMLDSFPEVLQMDCTHKTNRYEVLS